MLVHEINEADLTPWFDASRASAPVHNGVYEVWMFAARMFAYWYEGQWFCCSPTPTIAYARWEAGEGKNGQPHWTQRMKWRGYLVDPMARGCTHPEGCTSCNWCGFRADPAPHHSNSGDLIAAMFGAPVA